MLRKFKSLSLIMFIVLTVGIVFEGSANAKTSAHKSIIRNVFYLGLN